MTPRLKMVAPPAAAPDLEQLSRQTVERQAWLKREMVFELARSNIIRRRLADERGIRFIRPEAFAQEFGG